MYSSNPIEEILNGTPELTEEAKLEMAQEEQIRQANLQALEESAAAPSASETPNQAPTTVSAPKKEQNPVSVAFDALSAPGMGMNDWFMDLVNKVPGVNLRKHPKFQNEIVQSARDLSAVVMPTVLITKGAGSGLAAVNTKVGWKLGQDVAFKWFSEVGLGLGVGGFVDYISKTNETDDNLPGVLKKTWPRSMGWIPDDIATLDTDSTDVKRNKNITFGVATGFFSDLLIGAGKLARASKGIKEATRWIPENEKAAQALPRLIAKDEDLSDDAIENAIYNSAKKRSDELDELGSYNLTKSVDLDKPMLGVHDVYDYTEQGLRTVDDGGILGASVDVVRIEKNIDSVYGRVGSVVSEAALKYGLEVEGSGETIIRGLAETLKDSGKYGYETATGRYISHAEIMDAGERLAADFMKMDVDQMKRVLRPLQGVDPDTGALVLKSDAYAGVFKAIKGYMEEFMDLDYVKAQAYVGTSFAGQVSDMAQGMRLMEGTSAVERAQEQILDRLEFLMTQKGITSYARGRALNMLNLWNRVKRGFNAKSAADSIKEERVETLRNIQRIVADNKQTMATLRALKEERPEMLGPLMLAYEVTDGKVDTISKLNTYIRNSNATLSKAFFDGRTEIPSAYLQGVWSNVYNSMLSAVATPVKAGLSNTVLLMERPVATMAGGLLQGDKRVMRRAWHMYSGMLDTLQKGFGHMNQVYRRAAEDPSSVGYIMRDDIARKNEDTLELLRQFAYAKEQEGMYGPSAMLTQIEALNDLAEHPVLRFGTNAMAAFDGFTRAVVGNWEARGRAFDMVNAAGNQLDGKALQAISDGVYNEMFDETGMITDKAVEHASREISMNLDNEAVNALNAMISRAPVLKPFIMFPKTGINMLAFAGTHNPMGLFINQLNAFELPFEKMPFDKVEELLTSRGIPIDENMEMAYNTIRAELKGRKAVGTLSVLGASGMVLNNSLRGNGLYDKEKQKVRNEAGWKPRTYKGWDGKWHSYENLGAVSDWLAFTADLFDNFDTLNETDLATMANKAGYILSANLTNKSYLAGLEPMNDVLAGNPAAMSRWGASFASSLVPGSGLRAEFSRLFTPQLKELNQDLLQLIANRNPGMKDTLPDVHDWIDGGKVGVPSDIWTRIWNTYMPWKTHEGMSDEKQFLVDIEFDARPTLQTNGRGVDYTPLQRSQVTDMMGQDGYFKKKIREIMNTTSGKQFRKNFKDAQAAGAPVNVEDFQNIHYELRQALRDAKQYAEDRIDSRDEVRNLQYINEETKRQSRLGNVQEIIRLNNNDN